MSRRCNRCGQSLTCKACGGIMFRMVNRVTLYRDAITGLLQGCSEAPEFATCTSCDGTGEGNHYCPIIVDIPLARPWNRE